MTYKIEYKTPIFDPITVQKTLLEDDYKLEEKLALIELTWSAMYSKQKEGKTSSDKLPDEYSNYILVVPPEWIGLGVKDFNPEKTELLGVYQGNLIALEKNASVTDILVFCYISVHCDYYFCSKVTLDEVSLALDIPSLDCINSIENLVSMGWLEYTYDGYTLTLPYHCQTLPTGLIILKEEE